VICCQFLSGLCKDCHLLFLLLDNVVDRVHYGNIAHQSVLHGLPHRLFLHSLVRSRPASETNQNSLATVSIELCHYHCSMILSVCHHCVIFIQYYLLPLHSVIIIHQKKQVM